MKHSRKLFEELENTTVDKAIEWFLIQRERILKQAENDVVHSAAFYAAYKRLTDEFVEDVKKKDFPRMTEDLWGYEIAYDLTTVELMLVKYSERNLFADGKPHPWYKPECQYPLFQVEAKLLSIEEYANNYKVDPRTVTQWIRRGKIRVAKKIGNTWMIPEVADTPSRGYTPGFYVLEDDIRPLSDEYPFLKGAKHVTTFQDKNDKTKYCICCYTDFSKGEVYEKEGLVGLKPYHIEECDQKEREKIELALITHPKVKYAPGDFETVRSDLIRVGSEEENGSEQGTDVGR